MKSRETRRTDRKEKVIKKYQMSVSDDGQKHETGSVIKKKR